MNHGRVVSRPSLPWLPVFAAVLVALWAVTGRGAAAPPAQAGEEDIVEVRQVIDGDTIEVHDGGGADRLVRYLGIDTPELRRRRADGRWVYEPRPHAEEALAANRQLVEGKRVTLTYDKERHDRYGRLLAYVSVNGQLVNAELVERGFARVMLLPPNTRLAGLLLRLQQEARSHRRGIWSDHKTAGGPLNRP